MMDRPLSGLTVNLSISEGEDSTDHGFPEWQVNRITLQVASALVGQGVGMAFGHDWRDDGIMETIHGFACQIHSPFASPLGEDAALPPLTNLLPWPDHPALSEAERERLQNTLLVKEAGLPEELKEYETQARSRGERERLYRYLRARGLTHLRRELAKLVDARICIGGRRVGASGRYPGVIEEGYLALTAGLPLFVVGCLGGAAHQLAQALLGGSMPSDFCPDTAVSAIYEDPPVQEQDRDTEADRSREKEEVWRAFKSGGLDRLAASNELTLAENQKLLSTAVIDEVIQLLLTGLSRLNASSHPN